MATIYLRSSDGNDADDGSTWALAKATLAAAMVAAGAGGIVYMDDDHTETFTAFKQMPVVGTDENPVKVIVVETNTTTPVTTYSASTNIKVTNQALYFGGHTYFYGVNFESYFQMWASSSGGTIVFENSKLRQATSSGWGGASILGVHWKLIDVDLVNTFIKVRSNLCFSWKGGSYTDDIAAATSLISTEGTGAVDIEGVDLSGFEGINLCDSAFTTAEGNPYNILNCKLPSGVNYISTTIPNSIHDERIKIDACHTADGYYAFYRSYYAGDVQEETTIKRQGGASYDGTNEFSAKIVTNSNARESVSYLRFKLCSLVVDATTEKTLSAHIAYDSATTLQNDDIWLEVKYHDATDQALGKWARTKPLSAVSTPDRTSFTDVSGSETWDGTSGWTNEQVETIEQAITGGNGLVDVYVCVAKPSTTVYACPKVEIS